MFHDPLLSSLQDTMFALGFSKLKETWRKKCEHHRKSNKEESN